MQTNMLSTNKNYKLQQKVKCLECNKIITKWNWGHHRKNQHGGQQIAYEDCDFECVEGFNGENISFLQILDTCFVYFKSKVIWILATLSILYISKLAVMEIYGFFSQQNYLNFDLTLLSGRDSLKVSLPNKLYSLIEQQLELTGSITNGRIKDCQVETNLGIFLKRDQLVKLGESSLELLAEVYNDIKATKFQKEILSSINEIISQDFDCQSIQNQFDGIVYQKLSALGLGMIKKGGISALNQKKTQKNNTQPQDKENPLDKFNCQGSQDAKLIDQQFKAAQDEILRILKQQGQGSKLVENQLNLIESQVKTLVSLYKKHADNPCHIIKASADIVGIVNSLINFAGSSSV